MVLSVIGGRLLQLQGVDRSTYAASAADQRLHTITLPATRGTITDRNGQPIAETVDARNIVADPSQISDPTAVATALAPVLDLPEGVLESKLSVTGQYALLASEVPPAESVERHSGRNASIAWTRRLRLSSKAADRRLTSAS